MKQFIFFLTTIALNLIMLSNLLAGWEKCNLPYEGGSINSLSNDGDRIAFIAEPKDLYLSEDNGDNWTKIPFDIEVSEMTNVAINQNNIFVVADSYLYRSTNMGNSWALNFYAEVHSKSGGFLHCYNDSIFVSFDGIGLAKSYDNGDSWYVQGLSLIPLYFAKSDNLLMVASESKIKHTIDDGINWIDVNYPDSSTEITSLNIIGDKVFVGNQTGLMSSDDNFETWYYYENELPRSTISDIKVVGERVYIAYENFYGVYCSDNLGEDWSLIGDRVDDYIKEISVNDGKLFLGTRRVGLSIYEIEKDIWFRYGNYKSFLTASGTIGDYIFCTTGIGLMYSNNNGMDWTFNNFAASLNDILVIDSTLYLTFEPFRDSFISYESPLSKIGVLKSTDIGASWEALNDGIDSLPVGPIAYSNGTLFTGTRHSGIFRSDNFGISWEKIQNSEFADYISSIVIIDSTILVGHFQNTSVSYDFGETWHSLYDNYTNGGNYISIIGNKTFIRYASIRRGINSRDVIGISYDNGKIFDLNYRRDNVPFINNHNANISFDYADDRTIFSDDGDNWYDVESGLVSPARFIITKDNYLIVQTMDGDLYRIEIEKLKQLTHVENRIIQPKALIHPNPATEYIEIFCGSIGACSNENNIWASPNASLIMIYNTLGECVLTVRARQAVPLQRMDISHLPTGVYYLRVGNSTQMFVKI
jgi:photosystem II stability/assembly factor-like uncharacterized protein